MSTRHKILNKAARLFHEKGFSATTVREIASDVGIEAASLYNHMSSKSQLLEQICFETAGVFSRKMEAVRNADCTSWEKVVALIDFHLDMAFNDPKALTVFNQEWRHMSDPSIKQFKEERQDYERAFQEIFESGQRTGNLDVQLDAAIAVKMILTSVNWVYRLKKRTAQINESDIRRNIKLFIENAVLTNKC